MKTKTTKTRKTFTGTVASLERTARRNGGKVVLLPSVVVTYMQMVHVDSNGTIFDDLTGKPVGHCS